MFHEGGPTANPKPPAPKPPAPRPPASTGAQATQAREPAPRPAPKPAPRPVAKPAPPPPPAPKPRPAAPPAPKPVPRGGNDPTITHPPEVAPKPAPKPPPALPPRGGNDPTITHPPEVSPKPPAPPASTGAQATQAAEPAPQAPPAPPAPPAPKPLPTQDSSPGALEAQAAEPPQRNTPPSVPRGGHDPTVTAPPEQSPAPAPAIVPPGSSGAQAEQAAEPAPDPTPPARPRGGHDPDEAARPVKTGKDNPAPRPTPPMPRGGHDPDETARPVESGRVLPALPPAPQQPRGGHDPDETARPVKSGQVEPAARNPVPPQAPPANTGAQAEQAREAAPQAPPAPPTPKAGENVRNGVYYGKGGRMPEGTGYRPARLDPGPTETLGPNGEPDQDWDTPRYQGPDPRALAERDGKPSIASQVHHDGYDWQEYKRHGAPPLPPATPKPTGGGGARESQAREGAPSDSGTPMGTPPPPRPYGTGDLRDSKKHPGQTQVNVGNGLWVDVSKAEAARIKRENDAVLRGFIDKPFGRAPNELTPAEKHRSAVIDEILHVPDDATPAMYQNTAPKKGAPVKAATRDNLDSDNTVDYRRRLTPQQQARWDEIADRRFETDGEDPLLGKDPDRPFDPTDEHAPGSGRRSRSSVRISCGTSRRVGAARPAGVSEGSAPDPARARGACGRGQAAALGRLELRSGPGTTNGR